MAMRTVDVDMKCNYISVTLCIAVFYCVVLCCSDQAGRPKCPVDPFFIVPEKCQCIDYQLLKLQEAPEAVPNGELPRHIQLYCDRYLCDRVVPGNRVTVVGIYSIKKSFATTRVSFSDTFCWI